MIYCITFPRSGHHLLINLLFRYFSKDLDFPQIHGHETPKKCKKIIKAGNLRYCELYNHCQQLGCTEPVDIQKNHDFKLKLELPKDANVIVQYRKPLDTLISYFETFRKDQSLYAWEKFKKTKLAYYEGFINKWVKEKYFLVEYDSFLTSPRETLIYVLQMLNVGAIDFWYLDKCVKGLVRPSRNVKKFIYYNPKLEKINDKFNHLFKK